MSNIKICSTFFVSSNPKYKSFGVRIYDSFYGVTIVEGWKQEPRQTSLSILAKIIESCKIPSDAYGTLIQVAVERSGLYVDEKYMDYSTFQHLFPQEWLNEVNIRRDRFQEEAPPKEKKQISAYQRKSSPAQLEVLRQLSEGDEIILSGGTYSLKNVKTVLSSKTVKRLEAQGNIVKVGNSYVLPIPWSMTTN